jgi:4-amino-4-deoxy-L-arabinose transferase-like glycosyltransferase
MLKGIKLSHALVIITLTVACSILFFGIVYKDSRLYVQITRYYLGEASIKGVELTFALRPLIPLLAAPLAAFLWMPVAYGILNSILWTLSAILMYRVTLQITTSRRQALAAALLFTTSPSTLLYFGSMLVDVGGTFFALLILWIYLRLQDRLDKPSSLLAAMLVGVGILSKEITLPVVASILLLGVATRRAKWTFIWALLLIVPSMMWQSYTTLAYGENYWTYCVRLGSESIGQLSRAGFRSYYVNAVATLRTLALAHFPLAALCLIVGFLSLDDRRQNLTFYPLLLPPLIIYILLPWRCLRDAAITYYATMPLAGVGLDYVARSLEQKPLIGSVGPKAIWTILYLVHIALSISFAYNYFGTFSPPWNIYCRIQLP